MAVSTGAFAGDTGFAYSHDLRKEGGRLCMSDHYHSGSGSGRSKAAAQAAAARSWADFTSFEYGIAHGLVGRPPTASLCATPRTPVVGAPMSTRAPAAVKRLAVFVRFGSVADIERIATNVKLWAKS